MGAICFIPKFSQQKYLKKNEDDDSNNSNSLPYQDIFNVAVLEEQWKDLTKGLNSLFCQVHKINQSNPLFMATVASAYSLPKYLTAQ